MSHKYDDLISQPHHTSSKRPRMPTHDRAAQFAPFAALTGYQEVIGETSRLTTEKVELGGRHEGGIEPKTAATFRHTGSTARRYLNLFSAGWEERRRDLSDGYWRRSGHPS